MAPGWASPPAPGALSSTTAVSADPHQPHHQGTGDTGGWPSPPPSASSTTAPPHTSIPVISPTTTSPVRRKPLPQNAAAVIPPRRSESSSSASFSGGVSPADPPIPVTSVSDVQTHSRATLSQLSGLVPAEDPSLFVPRDLDRYESRSALCSYALLSGTVPPVLIFILSHSPGPHPGRGLPMLPIPPSDVSQLIPLFSWLPSDFPMRDSPHLLFA